MVWRLTCHVSHSSISVGNSEPGAKVPPQFAAPVHVLFACTEILSSQFHQNISDLYHENLYGLFPTFLMSTINVRTFKCTDIYLCLDIVTAFEYPTNCRKHASYHYQISRGIYGFNVLDSVLFRDSFGTPAMRAVLRSRAGAQIRGSGSGISKARGTLRCDTRGCGAGNCRKM